ncbi:MAG: Homoserine O-acetyltransferase [Fimbriimonadaceae bacterium]|nr:Homoserine O-acetyltransferase [Fimbriimonadaceae bacterium]
MAIDPAFFQENERLTPQGDERRFCELGSLSLEHGESLDNVVVAFETWGELSPARDNAILICHALSGDSHAIGWWERMIGAGKPIDTEELFVIGTNALGGCRGTTGPSSLAPDGKPYGSRFPTVTVRDMIDAQVRLLDHLGIERLLCVAGGSMGGMQALELTVRAPARVAKAWITASCAAHSAMQIGFNETARQAVKRDPKWRNGDYPLDDGPVMGMAVARMVGHLSYLSELSFETKFGRRRQEGREQVFQVESYLNYQGDKFTKRFDGNSLIVLSDAIDRYECPSMDRAQCEYLFTSFTSDWLYPSHQSRTLAKMAAEAHRPHRHIDIDLPFGHDSFLLDAEHQGAAVREFLSEGKLNA